MTRSLSEMRRRRRSAINNGKERLDDAERNARNIQGDEGRNLAYRDVPPAFGEHNLRRAAQGIRLRQAIAAIMAASPDILARDVCGRLDARALDYRRLPRKRAIQLHMQAIRRGVP